MTTRITNAHLEAKVAIINGMLGIDGPVSYSTPGAVRLYGAYGGTGVHRVCNEYGGVSDLMGYCGTKREAQLFLSGMIAALRAVQPVS